MARALRGMRGATTATVPRTSLLAELSDATDAITMLHGPAGSGKTTLLTAWVATLADPVTWIDAAAADGRALLRQLPHGPAARHVLIVDHAEALTDLDLDAVGAAIDAWPRVHAVIATRATRVVSRLALSSTAHIGVLDHHDLAITPADLASAAPALQAAKRHKLLENTGGLAVAVGAAIDKTGALTRSRYRERVWQALQTPHGLRASVIRMALVTLVDDDIADAIGIPAEHIRLAEEAGVGSYRPDGYFEVEPCLLEQLAPHVSELPAAVRHRLQRRAIEASLLHREPVAAMRLAVELGDLDLATSVALMNWVDLVERSHETYRVFAGVAATTLARHPVLMVLIAMIASNRPTTRLRGVQMFAVTAVTLRLRPGVGSGVERIACRALEASAVRLTPAANSALSMAKRSLAELRELTPEQQDEMGQLGPGLYTHLGLSALYGGDEQLADRALQISYSRYTERGDHRCLDPLTLRAGLAAMRGELHLARGLLDQAEAMEWPDPWLHASPRYFLELGLATVAIEDGDLDRAQQHLDAVGPFSDLVEHWSFFTAAQARLDLRRGLPVAGLARLERVRERREKSPSTRQAYAIFDAAEANLRLAVGDVAAARTLATSAARHCVEGLVALARVRLALSDLTGALGALTKVLERPGVSARLTVEAQILVAAVSLESGNIADGDLLVSGMLSLIDDTGLRSPLEMLDPGRQSLVAASLRRLGREELARFIEAAAPMTTEFATQSLPQLSYRERAVISALAETGSASQIADSLGVSPNTVKSQLRSIYRKLGVHTREEALGRAAVIGYLTKPAGRADDPDAG